MDPTPEDPAPPVAHAPKLGPGRRIDPVGPILALVGAAVYFATRQGSFWGDGLEFCESIEDGKPVQTHILYLPSGAALKWLLGITSENALLLLSALCGGASLWFAYAIGKLVLESRRGALLAALIAAGLPGYWFHSTVAEVHLFHTAGSWCLLAGLVLHALKPKPSWKNVGIVGLGHALSPATHLSGLSSTGVSWILGIATRRDRRLLIAGALGLGAFLLAYHYTKTLAPEFFRYYEANFQDHYYPALLKDPGLLVSYATILGSELLSYTAPASAFLILGFPLLVKRDKRLTATIALWILGYVAIVAPIGDRGNGGYYMVTAAPQCWIAAFALERLVAFPWRCALAIAAALVPVAIQPEDDPSRLLWSGGALVVVTILGWPILRGRAAAAAASPVSASGGPKRALFVLPAAAAVITFVVGVIPRLDDPCARRVRDVVRATEPDSRLLVADTDPFTRTKTWRLRFRMAGRADPTILSTFDLPAWGESGLAMERAKTDVTARLAAGRPVWLVVALDPPDPEAVRAREFLRWLFTECRVDTPPRGADGKPVPDEIVRVFPKDAPR